MQRERSTVTGKRAVSSDKQRRAMRLNHMGNTLLAEARTMNGRAADAMFRAALRTYEEALQVEPGMPEALVGVGCCRIALAGHAAGGDRRRALLRQARQALLRAEQLCGKAAAYNLACICALEGNLAGCRSWLERAQAELHLPPAEQAFADPDLAAVRDEPWLAELFPRSALGSASVQLTVAT